VLRNEARPDSDIDFLVEFSPGQKSFDRFLALSDLLEARLGHHVELVTTESLSPFLGPHILAKAADAFELREYLRHILAEADYLVTHSRGITPET
jgi:predicted nucleotidyltransferase